MLTTQNNVFFPHFRQIKFTKSDTLPKKKIEEKKVNKEHADKQISPHQTPPHLICTHIFSSLHSIHKYYKSILFQSHLVKIRKKSKINDILHISDFYFFLSIKKLT